MRRVMLSFAAVLLVALMPVAAVAQEVELEPEVEAELELVDDAVAGVDGATVEDCEAKAAEVAAAVDGLKAVAADLDYAAVDAAIADLDAACAAGDLDAAAVAAGALATAVADVEAAAGVAAPAVVDTGDGVNQGPNVALIGVAVLLTLLAGGAWALRRSSARH